MLGDVDEGRAKLLIGKVAREAPKNNSGSKRSIDRTFDNIHGLFVT